MTGVSDRTSTLPLADIESAGKVIGGRYRIYRLIGQGGMSAVYEAETVETSESVALKMLLPGLPDAASIAKRFRREARAASLLQHPNIVQVHDLISEGDTLYLVMELLRGKTIGDLLQAGPLRPRRALVFARQILDALAHAHAHGIIHRDLKPDNLMVVSRGEPGLEYEQVKLLDFGVAKVIGDAAALVGGDKLTTTGLVFGTPAYLSPEQALGRLVDPRTDLYSLGILIFEMLTGRTPFVSPDPVTLMRMQASAPPPTLASVTRGQPWCTPAVEQLVARALSKSPDQRFAHAGEMLAGVGLAFVSLDHVPAAD
jgi:eukaryotic-like serine/threonine-protein kinase